MRYFRTFSHLILTLLLWSNSSFASSGYDLYTERPSILKLSKQKSKKNGEKWKEINTAQLEFLAQLFGLYPEQTIYFIARDGEYMFDLAQVLGLSIPEIKKRARLINVSRINKNDPLLENYLIQEGLTEKNIIRNGVVLVDSGFQGSIPLHIQNFYSEEAQNKMFIHLAYSTNVNIPGSRSFKIDTQLSGSNYESMARYFRRSSGFNELGKKIVPISPAASDEVMNEDGIINRAEANEYSRDLLYFGTLPENIRRFKNRFNQWNYLARITDSESANLKDTFTTLEKIAREWTHPRAEAIISDFIEYHKIYFNYYITLDSIKPQLGVGLLFDPGIMLLPLLGSSNISQTVRELVTEDLRDFAFLTLKTFEKGIDYEWHKLSRIWSVMTANQLIIFLNELNSLTDLKTFKNIIKKISEKIDPSNQLEFSKALKQINTSNSCKKAVGK
jgi:hypothetical protein